VDKTVLFVKKYSIMTLFILYLGGNYHNHCVSKSLNKDKNGSQIRIEYEHEHSRNKHLDEIFIKHEIW